MGASNSSGELPPPLELECLSVLWRLGPCNVKQVRESLLRQRPLAYTTVMTVLDRLVKRGIVVRQKRGRSFEYSSIVEREQLQRRAVEQVVHRLFDGSADELRRFLGVTPARFESTSESNSSDGGRHSLDAALL